MDPGPGALTLDRPGRQSDPQSDPQSDLFVARFTQAQVVPWRNGRGTTRELRPRVAGLRDLRSPGDPRVEDGWWVSVADLRHPGPFSAYPGIERVLTPVGADIELVVDGGAHRLPAGEPFRFDGGAEAEAVLPNGSVLALNVFADSSRCRLDVRRRRAQQLVRPGAALIVLEGSAHLADGRDLGPLDLVAGPAHVLGAALVIDVVETRSSPATHL